MTEVYPDLWIGSWEDVVDKTGKVINDSIRLQGVEGILNVACDMDVLDTSGVYYAKCGLVDGPGNTLAAYHAASLILWAQMKAGPVIVVDHESGGRAAAVVIMYLHLIRRMGWDHWVKELGCDEPHAAHRTAFNRINWRLLSTIVEDTR